MEPRSHSDFGIYRRLAREARPYWPHLLALLVLSLLSIPLSLLTPIPLKLIVDNAIGGAPLPRVFATILPANLHSGTGLLIAAAALTVVIALLINLLGLGRWMLQTWVGENIAIRFKARLFRHIQRLSLSYHDEKGSADSIYRIQYDAAAIQTLAVSGVLPFIISGSTLIAMMWVIAAIDWQLALVAIGIAPILYILTGLCRRRLHDEWSAVKKVESSAMSVVHEVLGALRVVKAFGGEDFEQSRFVRHSSKGVRGHLRLAAVEGGFDVLVGFTLGLGTAAVLLMGVMHVWRGTLTLGELLMVLTYLTQFYGPLATISKMVTQLQSSLVSAERAFALLDQSPDVFDRPDARPLARAAGGITFRNVCFSYGDKREVLRDISFAAPPGTAVGIVGMTGSGKTTLLKLLTRFYDPTSGEILLDGVNLRDYRLTDLRNQFAIVLQDPVLFSTSIAENIAYARPEAAEEEITAAARAAHAHDFVAELPEGYQTTVGERGGELSGGERQRISIARAFLKKAPILILDEPTSSVDAKTEAIILGAMEQLMSGRTTFIVTHRPALLVYCSIVLHFDKGRLVEVEKKPLHAEHAPQLG